MAVTDYDYELLDKRIKKLEQLHESFEFLKSSIQKLYAMYLPKEELENEQHTKA